MTRKYYEAYEDRYKTAHAKGVSWSSDKNSPIVLDTIKKYKLNQCSTMLEIGCGEGRDSKAVLDKGYNLVATDISKEAVAYCKKNMPSYKNHFQVLDCINDYHEEKYDFIYSVAVKKCKATSAMRLRFRKENTSRVKWWWQEPHAEWYRLKLLKKK